MLASILNSPVAVQASIQVVRAFVRLRRVLASNATLRKKLDQIEEKLGGYDEQFAAVFAALRQLMEEEDAPAKPPIGYQTEKER